MKTAIDTIKVIFFWINLVFIPIGFILFIWTNDKIYMKLAFSGFILLMSIFIYYFVKQVIKEYGIK